MISQNCSIYYSTILKEGAEIPLNIFIFILCIYLSHGLVVWVLLELNSIQGMESTEIQFSCAVVLVHGTNIRAVAFQ